MDRDSSIDPPTFGDADDGTDRIDRGLNALFAAEVTSDVLEAIDVDALAAGEPIDRAVDVDALASALGKPAGRLAAEGLLRRTGAGGVAGIVVREAVTRVGARALERALVEADVEELLATIEAAVDPAGQPLAGDVDPVSIDEENAVSIDVEPVDDADGSTDVDDGSTDGGSSNDG